MILQIVQRTFEFLTHFFGLDSWNSQKIIAVAVGFGLVFLIMLVVSDEAQERLKRHLDWAGRLLFFLLFPVVLLVAMLTAVSIFLTAPPSPLGLLVGSVLFLVFLIMPWQILCVIVDGVRWLSEKALQQKHRAPFIGLFVFAASLMANSHIPLLLQSSLADSARSTANAAQGLNELLYYLPSSILLAALALIFSKIDPEIYLRPLDKAIDRLAKRTVDKVVQATNPLT